jgi:adenylate cyclase
MALTDAWQARRIWKRVWFSDLVASSVRRNLRMASGLILFTYIGAHLTNHALGLISLDTAERGMEIAVEVWYSVPGTLLLYGAAATHFILALWAVYERRTFRLPPLELLRIALGFTLPIILIGHAANTRLAYEMFGLSSDYTRVVANLWAADQQGLQLGLLAPGWLHGCLGLNFAFKRRPLFRQLRFVLFAIALLLPVFSALGFIAWGASCPPIPWPRRPRKSTWGPRTRKNGWRSRVGGIRSSSATSRLSARPSARARSEICSNAAASDWSPSRIPDGPCACRAVGACWRQAAPSTCRMPRCAAAGRAARPAACA